MGSVLQSGAVDKRSAQLHKLHPKPPSPPALRPIYAVEHTATKQPLWTPRPFLLILNIFAFTRLRERLFSFFFAAVLFAVVMCATQSAFLCSVCFHKSED